MRPDAALALEMDEADPLGRYREEFLIPRHPDGRPVLYFCGHSLGLQPRGVRDMLGRELDAWANLGVDAHFHGEAPWYSYHELFRTWGARFVGARPGEVVLMNSLTVNLHLVLVTFYRPRPGRRRILVDEPVFPSDLYALQSQIRLHGLDPADTLLFARPRPGEHTLRTEDLLDLLARQGEEIALVLLSGVNFLTGQCLDLPALTAAAHRQGCLVGCDLAHAAGNVVMNLHDWQVDFAVWCSYKYLNGGPGAVAGCFVHETHGQNLDLPRMAGWWGNDPTTRFRMHLQPDFVPLAGAHGWQVSNPPILALAPLRASLTLFDAAGMPALRGKSERLTGYLQYLLDLLPPGRVKIITPRNPAERGCQLSLLVHDRPGELQRVLREAGIVCDFREPNVLRVAPVPLYNTFAEVWTFGKILAEQLA